MTTVASPTQVRPGPGGRLTARCLACGIDLVQEAGAAVDAALVALDEAHPGGAGGTHSRHAPSGWRASQHAS